ncbi:hypothetical protein F2P56_035312 [Juglans regia]|uniref:Reverse transcriptase Ty1/copia-type domain-containing protein n=1 Tax=Juglans regia TaxID=51240 RepID=A0A833U1N2_JUGRE|nr:hypothetical protein F2P56_035312 [Juglans regia]
MTLGSPNLLVGLVDRGKGFGENERSRAPESPKQFEGTESARTPSEPGGVEAKCLNRERADPKRTLRQPHQCQAYQLNIFPHPPGFTHPSLPHHVCKLECALYGLKQAPRAWYSRISSRILALGFTYCISDSSLFVYNTAALRVYIMVYVDDILITDSSPMTVQSIISQLQFEFALKDLGNHHYFLGIEAIQVPEGIIFSRQQYIAKILNPCNMSLAKLVASPMASNTKLIAFDGDSLTDPTLFRSAVGSLQYLALTHPDISFSVNRVYLHQPRTTHWAVVKRILHYLKGTITHGLLL